MSGDETSKKAHNTGTIIIFYGAAEQRNRDGIYGVVDVIFALSLDDLVNRALARFATAF